jgi:hypothetical protein
MDCLEEDSSQKEQLKHGATEQQSKNNEEFRIKMKKISYRFGHA